MPSLGRIDEIELFVAYLNDDMHHHLLVLLGNLDSELTRKRIFDACCPPGVVQLSHEFHGQVAHFASQDPRIEPLYALLTDFEKVSKLFTFSRAAALRIQALYDFTPNLSKKSEHPFRFTAFHLGCQTPGVRTYPNMDDVKFELTKRDFKYFKIIKHLEHLGQSETLVVNRNGNHYENHVTTKLGAHISRRYKAMIRLIELNMCADDLCDIEGLKFFRHDRIPWSVGDTPEDLEQWISIYNEKHGGILPQGRSFLHFDCDRYFFSPDIKRSEECSIWSLTDNDLDLEKNLKVGSNEHLEHLASR